MAFAPLRVMAGVFHRQGRLAAALAYVLSNALAVLWTWIEGLHLSLLYEVFIASVVFLVLPERCCARWGALVAGQSARHDTQERARAYVRARMEATAAAFKSLYESMRSAFHPAAPNDNDAASVFDRAAGRICKRCPPANRLLAAGLRLHLQCPQRRPSPPCWSGGAGEGGLPRLLLQPLHEVPGVPLAANEELAALLCRRQFQSRLSEKPLGGVPPICRAGRGAGNTAAAELGAELVPDPVREKRLRQYLTAQGIDCRLAAYYDQAGHLRLELEGGAGPPHRGEGTAKLSKLVNFPPPGRGGGPPGPAGAGTERAPDGRGRGGGQKKDGQTVSGDTGAWFKHDDGSLYVLLCDGMGSGSLAEQESALAVRLLEQFLGRASGRRTPCAPLIRVSFKTVQVQ